MGSAYYTSVITTIAIVEDKIDNISNEKDFILRCRKRSIFTDKELSAHWNWSKYSKPFILKFLYIHSFPVGKRMNRKMLLDLGILTGEKNEMRGLKMITKEQFKLILQKTETNENIIVD